MNDEDKRNQKNENAGCLAIIGFIIIAICVGCISGVVYGWLTLGIGFLLLALYSLRAP